MSFLRGSNDSARRRAGSVSGRSACITALLLFANEPATSSELRLEIAEPLRVELEGDEQHVYVLPTSGAQDVYVLIRQLGVDVVVTADTADGESSKWDAPGAEFGVETIEAGNGTRVLVAAKNPGASGGSYEILVLDPAGLTPDRRRALSLSAGAGVEYGRGTQEGYSEAGVRYSRAAAAWSAMDGWRTAYSHYQAATAHRHWDEQSSALEHYEMALAILEDTEEWFLRGRVHNGIGLILLDQGHRIAEARTHFEAALEAAEAVKDHTIVGAALNNICLVARHHLGELREAADCYTRAIAYFEANERADQKAFATYNLAVVLRDLGEPDAARKRFVQALQLVRQQDNAYGIAKVLINWAELELQTGNYQRALNQSLEAQGLFDRVGRKNDTARAHRLLGRLYAETGAPERARTHLIPALTIFEEGKLYRDEAVTLFLLSRLASDGAEATANLQRALSRADDDPILQSRIRLELAETLLLTGDLDGAEEHIEAAMQLADDRGAELLRAQARLASARLLAGRERWREAAAQAVLAKKSFSGIRYRLGEIETILLQARLAEHLTTGPRKRELLVAAMRVIDDLWLTLDVPTLRASLLAAHREAVEQLVNLELNASGSESAPLAALIWVERNRARSFRNTVFAAGGPDDRRLDALEGKVTEMRFLLQQLLSDDSPVDEFTRTRRLARIDTLQAQLEGEVASIRDQIGDVSPFELRALQKRLAADEAIVEFFIGIEDVVIWYIDRDVAMTARIDDAAALEALAVDVHNRVRAEPQTSRATHDMLARLRDQTLGPFSARLVNKRRLLVIPDGGLWLVPFTALPGFTDPRRPLVRDAAIAYSHSLAAVGRASPDRRRTDPAGVSVLAVSNPVYSGDASASRSLLRLQPLPRSRHEAIRVLDVFPNAEKLHLTSYESSKARLLQTRGEFTYALLAVHGVLNTGFPALSGLVLSELQEDGSLVNGFLSTTEVRYLPWSAELTFLSGCDTAVGPRIYGEGLISLAREFLTNGSADVVATRWQVNDAAAAELADAFFSALRQNPAQPDLALQKAQLAILDARRWHRWHSPRYWSSHLLLTHDWLTRN